MRRGRLLLLIGVLLHPAALVWWLFGFSTIRLGSSSMFLRRSFGRIVRVDSDTNGDGRIDEQHRYSWARPMRGDARWAMFLSDADFDGRWDLWITFAAGGRNGDPLLRYAVDTDGDEHADWTFVATAAEAAPRIKARRGF